MRGLISSNLHIDKYRPQKVVIHNTQIHLMKLLPSHSPSVKSVAGNGGNSASVCGEYEPNRGNTDGWYYDTFQKSGLRYSLCRGCVANTADQNMTLFQMYVFRAFVEIRAIGLGSVLCYPACYCDFNSQTTNL